jgi:hypothetical protein
VSPHHRDDPKRGACKKGFLREYKIQQGTFQATGSRGLKKNTIEQKLYFLFPKTSFTFIARLNGLILRIDFLKRQHHHYFHHSPDPPPPDYTDHYNGTEPIFLNNPIYIIGI